MSSLRLALKLSIMEDDQKQKSFTSSKSTPSNHLSQPKHRVRSNSEASDSKRNNQVKKSTIKAEALVYPGILLILLYLLEYLVDV